jgi:hypothetical protein
MTITNPQRLSYPLINGRRWDFSSVTFVADGTPMPGIVSIDFSNELKGGEVYANSPQKLGSTRGQYKPTLSFDLLAEEYENFIFALCALNGTPGSGYMEVRWDLQVQKQDGRGLDLGPLYTDLCRGVKLDKVTKGYKSGVEGLVTKCECDVFYILENGQSPLTVNVASPKFVIG